MTKFRYRIESKHARIFNAPRLRGQQRRHVGSSDSVHRALVVRRPAACPPCAAPYCRRPDSRRAGWRFSVPTLLAVRMASSGSTQAGVAPPAKEDQRVAIGPRGNRDDFADDDEDVAAFQFSSTAQSNAPSASQNTGAPVDRTRHSPGAKRAAPEILARPPKASATLAALAGRKLIAK